MQKRLVLLLNTIILFTCLSLASIATASAGECVNCLIESIGTGPDFDRECRSGACILVRVNAQGGHFSRNACSSTSSWHYALDTSTDSGKVTLAQITNAYDKRKRIVIAGSDHCSVYSSRTIEDVGKVYHYWKKNPANSEQLYSYW